MPHGTALPARYAVFGHPIAHSLSPTIHRLFGEQCGIALEYVAIDAVPESFADAVHRFLAAAHGANVTLPHKAAAFALADERSAAATRAGSANVLTRRADGRLAAHNTDGAGLVRDLVERQQCALQGRRVLLLGAGGAARGVAWDLLDAGVEELTIANRTADTAAALAGALGVTRARARYWQDLAELGSFDLVVHATSAGVLGQPLQLPGTLVNPQTVGYDLSYGGGAQSFLRWAREAGARAACDGLGMLVEQAADAFALWHGPRPLTDPVYATMRAALA
ncbi:shikimate dehydrogenase [Frateuria terrea]|uniref:Shikimate dehydrogenase (NADP(+)) n=1 Tax=Frateuria terrea TaxID=529704 RepID=A0A1H6SS74_9GAMM|nr:shikimate dehydrogenase [Frateuria terrea]SEI70769.1 shikimate dehydrogenase [Frateuria terrea]SFP28362.1 shikimate dehydrogenase [Frateuria terrea]